MVSLLWLLSNRFWNADSKKSLNAELVWIREKLESYRTHGLVNALGYATLVAIR